MEKEIKRDGEVVAQVASRLKEILSLLGEDASREGLEKTPLRAAKALYYATSGYRMDAGEAANQAIFEYSGSKMIIVRDIEFYSFCEHHMLPFFGHVTIGYLPGGKMIGLSKLARVVEVFARRFQVQERMTAQICQAVHRSLGTRGVIVLCEAQHLCMKMRGVEKQDSSTTTVDYCGAFEEDRSLRDEFFSSLKP